MALISAGRAASGVWSYVQIARPDHWFKNAFMLVGVMLAFFYEPRAFQWATLAPLMLSLAATCLIASSNYVINELLDGPGDARHPLKRDRPVPSGQVRASIAYVEWLALGMAGIWLASRVDVPFALSALALWVMGIVYNVPPLRTKEWPYVDVLTESFNNPLRLLLGWFALVVNRIPPISLILAYWMVGAFFMGAKRFAEYRQIADHVAAARYRRSFGYYSEDRLLVSLFFYATAGALFFGIFIVRYHVELILFTPVAAALFSYYLKIALQPNSPVQRPEKLYKEPRFVVYAVLSAALFIALMFIRIPILYDWFNIEPSTANRMDALWTIGSGRP